MSAVLLLSISVTSRQLLVLFMLAVLILVSDAAEVQDESAMLATSVLEWIRSQGGFINDKLEIRRMEANNISTPLGVFARADIQPKEPLIFVPHSCFIALWDDAVEEDNEDEEDGWYYKNLCGLGRLLAKELKLGSESRYGPYIRYLQAQRSGQIPATWSDAGKHWLRKILPTGSDMIDWIKMHFDGTCNDVDEYTFALNAQRGYDSALIPAWDMFNHWNGRVNTENDPMYANDGQSVRASTHINGGDELYATYDECLDCRGGETWRYWGTPEILRDFGFVERYKQRWV